MLNVSEEEKHWALLGIQSHHARTSITSILYKVMDESRLLNMRIDSNEANGTLRRGIIYRIREMPSQIQSLMLRNPTKCLDSLSGLAKRCKRNTSRLWNYYKATATRMLHDEKVILVAPDGTRSTGIYLSNFLTRKRALYPDGTVDERHLDYQMFVERLVQCCGYDPAIHDISLWHEGPESLSRPEDANATNDSESWISAIIEEQNMLQSSRSPLVFHVAESNMFYLGQSFTSDVQGN